MLQRLYYLIEGSINGGVEITLEWQYKQWLVLQCHRVDSAVGVQNRPVV